MSGARPALLIGTTRPSLPAVRSLGRRGVPIWVATQERGVASSSRYVRDFFPTASPLEDPVGFCERLCEIGRSFPQRPVLIPCDDLTVGVIAEHHEVLAGVYRLVGPSPQVALRVLDKGVQYELIAESGVPVPRTWTPRGPRDAEAIAREARFPLVAKPATAQQFLVTHGFKALPVASSDELAAILDRFGALIVQETIPGEVEDIYEHNSFVDRDGRVVVSSVARKRDEDPKPFGSATAIEIVNEPVVEQLGLRVVRTFDFQGSSHAEFKYDRAAAEFKFIEFNPRFAWSAMVQLAAGVDTIYPVYAEAAGLPFPPSPPRLRRTVWLTPERITKGKAILPPRPLPESIPGRARYVFDVFDPGDPRDIGPLYQEVRNAVLRRITRPLRALPTSLVAPVSIYQGRGPHDEEMAAICIAPDDVCASLLERLFRTIPTPRRRGWWPVWNPPTRFTSADLVITAPAPGRFARYLRTGWRSWPVRVRHEAELDRSTRDIVAAIDPSLVTGCGVTNRSEWSAEAATGDRCWGEFYEKIYRPTIRNGRRGDVPGLPRLHRLARDGRIDFAVRRDTRVAGVLTVNGGEGEVRVLGAGVLYGSRHLRDSGALAAAYAFAIEHARDDGCRRVVWETDHVSSPAACSPGVMEVGLAIRAHTPVGTAALRFLQAPAA